MYPKMTTKNKPTFTKLSKEKQEQIKQKYMEGYSGTQLAKEYNLVPQSLNWYINHHKWNEERRLARAELFQAFSDTKKAAFTGIYMDGTTLLKKAVQDALKEYDRVETIKERLSIAKEISQVIKELDKIQRLDDGAPTEIKEERPFSITELKKELNKDPFYTEEIDNVSFKEISPSDNSD